jgi:hypothetical protein
MNWRCAMSTIKMDMSSYELESEWNNSAAVDYSEEVLCSGWNPSLSLAVQENVTERMPARGFMPADLAALDRQQRALKKYVYLSFE